MAIRDEIKKEQEKLKDKPLKYKLAYFWEYYKIHTIVTVIAIVLIATMIRDIRSNKDYAFYATLINSTGADVSELASEFETVQQVDTKKYQVFLDTSLNYQLDSMDTLTMATTQKILATIAAGELDVMVSDEDTINHFAKNDAFCDLKQVLPEDLIEKYKDDFLYIEGKDLNATETETGDGSFASMAEQNGTLTPTSKTYNDPSEFEEPIAVGIYLTDTDKLDGYQCFSRCIPVYSIVSNSTRQQMAIDFLYFLTAQ